MFLFGPFCHGAFKLDQSTLFATGFVRTCLQFIFSSRNGLCRKKREINKYTLRRIIHFRIYFYIEKNNNTQNIETLNVTYSLLSIKICRYFAEFCYCFIVQIVLRYLSSISSKSLLYFRLCGSEDQYSCRFVEAAGSMPGNVHGKPVLFWKGISGLKFPCFLFYACEWRWELFEFRAVPILLRKLPNIS